MRMIRNDPALPLGAVRADGVPIIPGDLPSRSTRTAAQRAPEIGCEESRRRSPVYVAELARLEAHDDFEVLKRQEQINAETLELLKHADEAPVPVRASRFDSIESRRRDAAGDHLGAERIRFERCLASHFGSLRSDSIEAQQAESEGEKTTAARLRYERMLELQFADADALSDAGAVRLRRERESLTFEVPW